MLANRLDIELLRFARITVKQPAGAVELIDRSVSKIDDPKSAVNELLRTRKNHTLLPEAGTKPRVFYLT